MRQMKFNGILKEIAEQYPNVDAAGLLSEELRIPLDKAEVLADRIEKEYLQENKTGQNSVRMILEKPEKSELSTPASVYSISSLSEKEFEHFTIWLLEELGYEVYPGKCAADWGVDLVAAKDGDKISIVARRYPKTYKVSDSILLLSQEAKRIHACNRSIVLSTTYFTQQAAADAQRLGVELWDIDALAEKITQVREKADVEVQSCFPAFEGSLLQSLLRLAETKTFIIETRAGEKYDLYVPGVKFPLLTFQARSNAVIRCVYRIRYNDPVTEADGEALISTDRNNSRAGPDDVQAYTLIIQYLEQFME